MEMPKLRDMLRKHMPEPIGDAAPAPEAGEASETAEDASAAEKTSSGPIDPAALKGVFGDDEDTFKEILEDFIDPATSNVREIEAAFADRSADGVARAAHKLKSSARSVGAYDLADLCEALETAGNVEIWDEIDDAAPRLTEKVEWLGMLSSRPSRQNHR